MPKDYQRETSSQAQVTGFPCPYGTVKEAALACRDKYPERPNAIAALVEIVRTNPALLLEITEAHLVMLCSSVIRKFDSEGRRTVSRSLAAQNEAANHTSGQRLLNSGASLLSWRLVCGTPIADAGHRELRLSAKHYKTNGATQIGHGKWLDLVANNLPKGKKARHFTDDELKGMWDKTHA